MSLGRKTAPPTDLWMSLNKAAIALGEARPTVLQRIVRNELRSSVVDGRTVVSRDDVQHLLDERAELSESAPEKKLARARR